MFIGKGVSEFAGNLLVQYAGIAGVTDFRNHVYAKILRQPIGFFQHHPTGRVMSTVINDVERVRNTFSEYLALGFRHIFTLFFLLVVLLAHQLEDDAGFDRAASAGRLAGAGRWAGRSGARRKRSRPESAS